MLATVCQLRDDDSSLEADWGLLVRHVAAEGSDLVLLPEMPFCSWFAASPVYDETTWRRALAAHDDWMDRLAELAPAAVISTRPTDRNGVRRNEAYLWRQGAPVAFVHEKRFLPDENHYWEAAWYGAGDGDFRPFRCGEVLLGAQICTEIWRNDQSRLYGASGVHVIAVPRASPASSRERWLVAGRMAAITAGAYCLSSNAGGWCGSLEFGGQGWVIDPDGEILALTSEDRPFATVSIDPSLSDRAKHTYPRYVA